MLHNIPGVGFLLIVIGFCLSYMFYFELKNYLEKEEDITGENFSKFWWGVWFWTIFISAFNIIAIIIYYKKRVKNANRFKRR